MMIMMVTRSNYAGGKNEEYDYDYDDDTYWYVSEWFIINKYVTSIV